MSQHQQRPRDILEFLRRASSEEPPVEVAPPEPAPTPHVTVSSGDAPMVVLRRSQVIVAGVAAGLLIILAFLLGLASGESEAGDAASGATRFYTIKIVEFPDNRNGEINAKTLMADLERRFDEEVTIERLDRDRTLFVALGSWLKNPKENPHAVQLLREVQGLTARGRDDAPFKDAYFFPIKR